VRVDGVDVLLTSRPVWFVGRAVYLAHGLDLAAARVAVVKSPNGFRPHWAHHAAQILAVDGDGPTTAALHRLPYRRVGRPVFPLDEVDGFAPAAEVWRERRLSP
jgi:microcystin degradation protein MlrC